MALSDIPPRTRSPVFAGTGIDLGHPMPPARPIDLAAVRGVQTQSLPGDPTIGFRPTPGIGRFQRREAPVAPAPMLITPEPVAAPRAPAAPSSAPGGLGGLGGFGDTLEAVGYSMMTGGHGNLFGNFPQAMEGIRSRREAEAERARAEQERAMQAQGLRALGREMGFSDEEIAAYGNDPAFIKAAYELREKKRGEAEREAMRARADAMMQGLGGAVQPQGQPTQNVEYPLGVRTDPTLQTAQPGATVAPAPAARPAGVAPRAGDAPVDPIPMQPDPYAEIRARNEGIARLEAAAAAQKAAGDPILAASLEARAEAAKRDRDLLVDRLPPVQGPSSLARLQSERDAMQDGDPRIPAWDQAIAREAAGSAGMTVYGPDGRPIVTTGNATGGSFTEAQSKDNVFSTRARGALEVLEQRIGNDPDSPMLADALTSRFDRAGNWIPGGFGREWQSEDFQVAEQAGDEFLQAILRKDTGAAITAPEQELYGKTYLPQPGDGPAVLQAKAAARRRAIAAIESGMSPAQMLAQERALQRSRVPDGTPQRREAPAGSNPAGGVSPDVEEILFQFGVE